MAGVSHKTRINSLRRAIDGDEAAFAIAAAPAGAEQDGPGGCSEIPRHSPAAAAAVAGQFLEGGAAEAAARGEHRHCLKQVRLAGSVGAAEGHDGGGHVHTQPRIIAEVGERQAGERQ
jgi:hypothetical protein